MTDATARIALHVPPEERCWADRLVDGEFRECGWEAATDIGLCAECYQQVVDGC